MQVTHGDGNMSLDLAVESVKQYTVAEAEITEILLKDKVYPFFVKQCYKAYKNSDVIGTWVEVTNQEKKPVTMYKFASAFIPVRRGDNWLTHFHGTWGAENMLQGERLHVNILQVEYGGIIIPVELAVYDNDGQGGIFIPGSMEANAVREVAANLGQNLGTSISITNQSAGDQLLSELGKGAIQGVSQYISRKMREEKVHLKSGYTLMLYQDNDQ